MSGDGAVVLGSGTLVVGGNDGSGTFAGGISGSGGLTKIGSGTQTLTGSSSYTGATTINQGTLQYGSGQLSDATDVEVNDPGVFNLNHVSDTIDALSGNGSVTLGNGTLMVGGGDGSGIFAGVIFGAGGLTKIGAGTQTITGNNTYAGGTTVSGGTLQGNTNSLQGDILDNANVTFDQATGGTYAGTVSGTGSLTKTESGTLTLTSSNTYTGNTHLVGGTLQVGSTANLGSGPLVFSGGVLNTTASLTNGRGVTLNSAGGTFDLDAGTTFTQTAAISGNGGFTKTGAGVLLLHSTNTFSGFTSIAQGILRVGTGQLPDTTTVSVNNGATFDLNDASDTIGVLAGNGSVTLGSGELTVTAGQFQGPITETGDVTKIGGGQLGLFGTNTFSGSLNINSGSVQVINAANLGGGSLSFDGGALATLNTFTASHDIQLNSGGGTIAMTVAEGIRDGAAAALAIEPTLTLSGGITGPGSLSKTGFIGAVELVGANTYSGGTIIQDGTLVVNNTTGSATGSGLVTITANATLAGGGTILGSVEIQSAATLAPGNSSGMLVAGDVELVDGATYQWELDAAMGDRVEVNGILTLGANVTLKLVDLGGTPAATDRYVLFDYSPTTSDPSNANWTLDGSRAPLWDISSASVLVDAANDQVVLTGVGRVPEPTGMLLLISGYVFFLLIQQPRIAAGARAGTRPRF